MALLWSTSHSTIHRDRKGLPMSGIPVLCTEGDCIARAWENALVMLYNSGCDIQTQYDKPDDPPSKDATMIITVHDPLREPMIHRDFPGGFEQLQEYVMEVCDGIKDHWVRDRSDASDTRWEYTYHQRLFAYEVPTLGPTNQIEHICRCLAETPYSRRAQAITWKVWEDTCCYDAACLQSIWCRMTREGGKRVLSMNLRFRSNDAYKAAFMNIFALVNLQKVIAERIEELCGEPVHLGRYCHMADSFHIYGANLPEFKARFLGAIQQRRFEDRTMRYEDVRPIMEEARPAILQKARRTSRSSP
jgi:thymidylate synthase